MHYSSYAVKIEKNFLLSYQLWWSRKKSWQVSLRGAKRRGNLGFSTTYKGRDCFTSFAMTISLTFYNFINSSQRYLKFNWTVFNSCFLTSERRLYLNRKKVIPNPSISLRVNSVRNLKFLILRCSRFLGFPRNDKNTNYDTASKGRRERGKICERLTSPRLVNSQGLIGKKLTHWCLLLSLTGLVIDLTSHNNW